MPGPSDQSFNETDQTRYCLFVDMVRPSPFPGVMRAMISGVRFLTQGFKFAPVGRKNASDVRLLGWGEGDFGAIRCLKCGYLDPPRRQRTMLDGWLLGSAAAPKPEYAGLA